MTDDAVAFIGFAFVFLHEFKRTRKRHLTNVAIKLFFGHPDTVVFDGDGFRGCGKGNINTVRFTARLIFTKRCKSFQFGGCIAGIGDEFS